MTAVWVIYAKRMAQGKRYCGMFSLCGRAASLSEDDIVMAAEEREQIFEDTGKSRMATAI